MSTAGKFLWVLSLVFICTISWPIFQFCHLNFLCVYRWPIRRQDFDEVSFGLGKEFLIVTVSMNWNPGFGRVTFVGTSGHEYLWLDDKSICFAFCLERSFRRICSEKTANATCCHCMGRKCKEVGRLSQSIMYDRHYLSISILILHEESRDEAY